MNFPTTDWPRSAVRLVVIGLALLAVATASTPAQAASGATKTVRLYVATYAAASCKAADAANAIGNTMPIRFVSATRRVPVSQLSRINNTARWQARRFPALERGLSNPLLRRLLARRVPTVHAQLAAAAPAVAIWVGFGAAAAAAAAAGVVVWCVYETVEWLKWREEFENASIDAMQNPNDPYARKRFWDSVQKGIDAGYGDGGTGGHDDSGQEEGTYDPVPPPPGDGNSSYSSGNDFPDASVPGGVAF